MTTIHDLPLPVMGIVLSNFAPWEAKEIANARVKDPVLQIFESCYNGTQEVVWGQWALAYQVPEGPETARVRVVEYFGAIVARVDRVACQLTVFSMMDRIDVYASVRCDKLLWERVPSIAVVDKILKAKDLGMLRLFIDLMKQFVEAEQPNYLRDACMKAEEPIRSFYLKETEGHVPPPAPPSTKGSCTVM